MSPSFNQEKNGVQPSAPSTPRYKPPQKRSARSVSPQGPDSRKDSGREEKRRSHPSSSSSSENGNQRLSEWWCEKHFPTPSLSPNDFPAAPAKASGWTPSKSPLSSTLFPGASSPSPQQAPKKGAVHDSSVVPGIILRAPRSIEQTKLDSPLLAGQQWVNSRVANHPLLIWSTYRQRPDGELIARCLQMTSFNGKTCEGKYSDQPRAWRLQAQYLPMYGHYPRDGYGKSPLLPAESWTNMPLLRLEERKMMDKQTYVHLDHYFEIEARHLLPYALRNEPLKELHLNDDSMSVVLHKLRQFGDGRIYRNKGCSFKSPLEYGRKPAFEAEDLQKAEQGLQLEALRYEQIGKREVTGYEFWSGIMGRGSPPDWEIRPFAFRR